MGDKHVVRFEPVGIEIEVDEDQTILRAAAEQGVQLMHGCKEGQCAACKSFVLEGDMDNIDLDRYSTFALPDYEKEEGQTLLCRAHAYEDLVIELLNYDEEIIRGGLPLRKGVVEVVSNEPVTHDMRHLVVKLVEPEEIKFFPGQYMDFMVPGTDESRSFSMANTPNRDGRFEFVIKIYPDGLFSEHPGRQGAGRRPPGGGGAVRHLHPAREPHVGSDLRRRRGGHGARAGPAAVDGRARRRAEGDVLLRRARRSATCASRRSSRRSASKLPGFRYIPALSEPVDGEEWDGETGLITDVVQANESESGGNGCLCLRSAADGGRGDRHADRTGRAGTAHLLRQVHHHR